MALVILVHPLFAELAFAPTNPPLKELVLIQENSVMGNYTSLPEKPHQEANLAIKSDNLMADKYQAFLREELLRIGKTEKDFLRLKEVYFCESRWRQYNESGEVLISKGNVGISQINISAHYKTYTEMGLDIYEPYDNLRFGAFLYARDGLNPWLSYSGHCFLPRIRNL